MSLVSLKAELRQQLKLSPQLLQSMEILQMNSQELLEYLGRLTEENPLLEQEDAPSLRDAYEELRQKASWIDGGVYGATFAHAENAPPERGAADRNLESLAAFLRDQLERRRLPKPLLALSKYIAEMVDEDGYLDDADLDGLRELKIPQPLIQQALDTVQSLDPAGVGARNLSECLLLQMEQLPMTSRTRRLARKILTSHFEEFVKKHYEKLIVRLQVSEDDFREALAEIRRLSPKPGNLYSEGGTDATPYIIPDFMLDYHDGRFDLSLNSYNVPEVKVNRRYVEMIRGMVASDGTVRQEDREAIQFVKNKIDSAKWFISAIKQRHDTLMRTMQEILDYQREYFRDGDKSKLRPMILKDIADRTGLDVSTISRVVNSKYVQTHFGIILLKSLFSEAMQTESGEEVSSYEIKTLLQRCIDDEDKRRPLTDETLMDMLNDRGYRIARRTVAKYREMLGIPVARLRKQI
jgi:RNA polymerase sigma-54 factor